MHTGERPCQYTEQVAIGKSKRGLPWEVNPLDTFALDFQPLERWENKLLFKSHSLWYFLMEALYKPHTFQHLQDPWFQEHKRERGGNGSRCKPFFFRGRVLGNTVNQGRIGVNL